jgi:threonylcarbamoyladenosine tRNA methylthiotransferase MtaB
MIFFSIRNFGCRVNQAEAFGWVSEFQRLGLAYEPDAGRSDLVILNSCTLTSRADRDARKFVHHVARANPGARIVVTGCLAERSPGEVAAWPGVWKVIPNAEKDSLPVVIWDLFSNNDWANPKDLVCEGIAWFRKRAFLKVQDGCDMSCAFCIIPSVRGKSRSVPPEAVLARLEDFERRGFREVILAGIHLSSYGRDLDPRTSLDDLLRRIEAMPGGLRVRLSSLDPRLTKDAFIDFISASKRIRSHYHLSLQHGSERMLSAMGRAGTRQEYLRILERFRDRAPRAALGADILVGFPGETEEDFRGVEEFLEASPLTYVHVFPYSARPGTPAAGRPAVDGRTRKERAVRLRAFGRDRDLEFRRRQEGQLQEAIVIRRTGAGAAVQTANAIDVRVSVCDAPEGEAVVVRIGRATDRETLGEIFGADGAA